MPLIFSILALFPFSVLLIVLSPLNKRIPQLLSILSSILLLILFLSFVPQIIHGSAVDEKIAWIPGLNLDFLFRLNGLSLLFSIIVSGIAIFIFLYSGQYMAEKPNNALFFALLLSFTASMLGLVLSDNVILLYVFWELTSLFSFFLIGFDLEKSGAPKAAWQALIVTTTGGLCLLAAAIIMGFSSDSFQISSILRNKASIVDKKYWIIFLLLIAAFTKSAQFPFHFWLPDAMVAPTPVSAYIHSATMVNAGIYLICRFYPLFDGSKLWKIALMSGGAVTALLTGYNALKNHDSKRILAYSTCSALGLIIFMLGQGSDTTIKGAISYLFTHALYKSVLFMTGGVIDHNVGTRDVRRLGGLGHFMPFTAGAAVMAAISKSGLPPSLGMISKEFMYKGSINFSFSPALNTSIVLLISAALASVAFITGMHPYLGKPKYPYNKPHEAKWSMTLASLIPASMSVIFAFFPSVIENTILFPAIQNVKQMTGNLHLALWHGFNLSLYCGISGVVLGYILFLYRRKVENIISHLDIGPRIGPLVIYNRSIQLLIALSDYLSMILQRGSLSKHLKIIYCAVIITVAIFSGRNLINIIEVDKVSPGMYVYENLLALIIIVSAIVTVTTRSRFGAVSSLGVMGFGVALVLLNFGAPDVAVTQILVDTITVFILVLASRGLPLFRPVTNWWRNLLNICISISLGILTTVLILAATKIQLKKPVSEVLLSGKGGHTSDIVTSIISDVRAFDTIGEITVLLMAGIGVYTLLKINKAKNNG